MGIPLWARRQYRCLWRTCNVRARIYRQLKRLQGEVVPVYLGNIGLIEPYVDLGVEIVHMLLMSWGGGGGRVA
jgi:hypothetical protein